MTPRSLHGWAQALCFGGALAVASIVTAAEPVAPASGEWNFQVLLDGKPVGRHRFVLEADGALGKLTSQASFDVKVLGFTVYRYRHRSTETWRGNCLVSLASATDDDGKPSSVHFTADGERDSIVTLAGTQATDGCLMSFAYWNPAIRSQTRLLNGQTGKIAQVQVQRIADARIAVRGDEVVASGYRITGAERPIDVWYAPDGRWVGLDSVVEHQHKLSYRLQ